MAQGYFLFVTVLIVGLTGCASSFTPLQEKAWDAFKDCQKQAPTAVLGEVLPDGRLSFTAREGDYQIMKRCLEERYGYRFPH